ncbi:LOW QUALITY PROTEIN: hypothetical protein M8C21_014485 [Ambrosia artemisiifolia]|uniref:Transmembrane protein 230 n=1 Tax=Ambrosia artemisiifolia TaxID=4212 RepID=A0AAD5D8Q3_AMBAR|nr:LOW QUALITY PROTEIN: hypothetical protein M8C21_014485 [Ambrosia artemisiifolia]
MRICKYKRVKPPLPTHLSPSPFLIPPYSLGEFEFGLDACGVSELVFSSSDSTQIDMTFKRNFKYTRLAVDEDSKCTFDPRFDFSAETSDKVPWKSIGLALFLLLFGCVLLLLSLAIFTGYMRGDISQAYGLFGLGTLTFLPDYKSSIMTDWRKHNPYTWGDDLGKRVDHVGSDPESRSPDEHELHIIHGGVHTGSILQPSQVVLLVSAVECSGGHFTVWLYVHNDKGLTTLIQDQRFWFGPWGVDG